MGSMCYRDNKRKRQVLNLSFSFGDPYGFLPLVKGKANISLRGVCCPTLVERTHLGSAIPWIAKRKHTPLSVFLFFGDPYGNRSRKFKILTLKITRLLLMIFSNCYKTVTNYYLPKI